MTSIWEVANPQLRDLAVYEPGKPIEETARELGLDPGAIVKLASNENPLGHRRKQFRRCAQQRKAPTYTRMAADFTCAKQSPPN